MKVKKTKPKVPSEQTKEGELPRDINRLQRLAAAKEKSGDLEGAFDLYQKVLDISLARKMPKRHV